MGKKKAEVMGEDSAPASNIFRTLFSAAEEGTAAIPSIFSDENPFKRKPEEHPKVYEAEGPEIDAEPKKKKRDKVEDSSFDSGEETEMKRKKKKKKEVKLESAVLAAEGGENDLGGNKKAEKKKRKREEVEREYEEKRYGPGVESPEPEVRVGGKRKKPDADAGETLKKEEGFDDEEKLLRTVFVGNLPLKVKKKALLKEFIQFGEVESVRIRSVPVMDTKIPRKGAIMQNKINDAAGSVHAYIVYKTMESAEASLSHNMAVVAGNHIRVDRACPPRKKLKGEEAPLYDNKRTIFMGNLPFDVKDEEIYQLFTGIKGLSSGIEGVRVVRDPNNGLGKGIAYLLLKDKESVNLVMQKRSLKLRDREIRLSRARQQDSTTPTKRANPFSGDRSQSPSNKKFARGDKPTGGFGQANTTAYEGWRAKKSGVQKKPTPQLQTSSRTMFKKRREQTRDGKRPSVAARKAKALGGGNDGGGSGRKATGKKRKLETPNSSNWKKAKKPR
ncbi:unnamed protein product [Linum trigynum]|uniref:RRM domain-containing protein n=1 Tax=Linum trigynum TaxID=586398 RepID=A0AAV2DRJ8_9ROSI